MKDTTLADREKPTLTEQEEKHVVEQLWLNYYNDTLYAKGIISEDAHRRMRRLINKRPHQ